MSAADAIPLVGSLIQGIGGATSSAIDAKSMLKLTQIQNMYNERMLQKQMDYNTQMTDPAYQKERLKNAGINPALSMQNGSVNMVGSTPSALPVNTPQIDTSTAFQGLAGAVDTYLRFKNANSQNANLDAQTNNLRIEGQYIASKSVAELTRIREETKSIETKRMIDEITKQFLPQLNSSQINYLNSEAQQLHMTMKLQGVEYMMKSQRLKQFPTQLKLELGSLSADIAYKLSQKQLTDKQAETEVQKAAESIVRQESVRLRNEFNSKTMGSRIETIKAEMWRAINNSNADNPFQLGANAAETIKGWFK